jgi:DNA mismatch endonuclease (patch repair protein)
MDSLNQSMHRKWNMGRIHSKNTKPELLVRSLLHRHGFRFRLHVRYLPGCPDIVMPKHRIAIFVNGCFWHLHGCSNSGIPKTRSEWWKDKLESNAQRDVRNYSALALMGWKVIVVWECQFRRVSSACLDLAETELIQN